MRNLGNRCGLFSAMVILLTLIPQAHANLITNGSFEDVTPVMSPNEICYSATGTPYPLCTATGWTSLYQIGNGATIGVFGVSFGIPQPEPDGSHALILQETNAATQLGIIFPTTGDYTLTFNAANRSNVNNGPQTVALLLDGTAISGGTFTGLPAAWTLETLNFSASAGSHSITFEGLISSADATAFIDNVSLVPQASSATPEPSSLTLVALAAMALLIKQRGLKPRRVKLLCQL